jgi:lipid II:glycine glycyltransferase (peptidoglycan interpeptide bridge formation enzyme)
LHDYAIKWGISNNFVTYDLGGTSTNFTDSLFKFKEQFGGQSIPVLVWEKGYQPLPWNFFKTGRHIYRKLKYK